MSLKMSTIGRVSLKASTTATNVHVEVAPPNPESEKLPGERRSDVDNYSKLVPPSLRQQSPEVLANIAPADISKFFAEQVKQHDVELGLDDMNQIQPHPLLYSPSATSTASAPIRSHSACRCHLAR